MPYTPQEERWNARSHAVGIVLAIVPYYPDCPQSTFGPTWHTLDDDMQHIDRNTLKAVGQTVVQVLWTEN